MVKLGSNHSAVIEDLTNAGVPCGDRKIIVAEMKEITPTIGILRHDVKDLLNPPEETNISELRNQQQKLVTQIDNIKKNVAKIEFVLDIVWGSRALARAEAETAYHDNKSSEHAQSVPSRSGAVNQVAEEENLLALF